MADEILEDAMDKTLGGKMRAGGTFSNIASGVLTGLRHGLQNITGAKGTANPLVEEEDRIRTALSKQAEGLAASEKNRADTAARARQMLDDMFISSNNLSASVPTSVSSLIDWDSEQSLKQAAELSFDFGRGGATPNTRVPPKLDEKPLSDFSSTTGY